MFSRLFRRDDTNDPIWFSRDIQQSLLRRWMIVVQSVRIMLIRQPDGSYRLETDAIYGWTPQTEMERLARQGRISLNDYDRHVLIGIGYTRLPRKRVSDCFDDVRSRFPTYFSWTQCQDFLRQFVGNILDRQDPQWPWFFENTDTSRQDLSQLPLPPAHVMAAYYAQQQGHPQPQSHDAAIQANRLRMQQGVAMQIQQQNQQINQQLLQNNQNNFGYGY